jgi:hypothetical protein
VGFLAKGNLMPTTASGNTCACKGRLAANADVMSVLIMNGLNNFIGWKFPEYFLS